VYTLKIIFIDLKKGAGVTGQSIPPCRIIPGVKAV